MSGKRIFEPLPFTVAAGMAMLMAILLQSFDCLPSAGTCLAVCIAVTTTTIMWISHLRFMQEKGFRKFQQITLGFIFYSLRFFLLFIITIVLSAFIMPNYDCYGDRSIFMDLMGRAETVKEQISAIYLRDKSIKDVEQKVAIPPLSPEQHLFITTGGTIIATTDILPGFVILTPNTTGQTISWSCHARPVKAAPKICKG